LKASSLGSSLLCRENQFFGAAVGDDVEEAQELAVKAPAGGDDARQEGVLEGGISGPSSDPLQDFFSRVFFCIYSTRAYCLVLT